MGNVGKKRRSLNMVIPTLIMFVIAVVLVVVGYRRGEGEHVVGLNNAWHMTIEILDRKSVV